MSQMEEKPEKWTPLVRGTTQGIIQVAGQMREAATSAERILWEHLRERRLNGLRFRRQHAVGQFVLDFYCPQAKLGIELDGGVHEKQRDYDQARSDHLATYGYGIIRFANTEIDDDLQSVLRQICLVARSRIEERSR